MLYSVNVLNPSNDELVMELTNPEKCGFAVMSIDGIGPTKSNVNIYDVPSIDGGLFVGARTQTRNITIKLRYLWDPLIEDARHRSYRFFPLKRKVKLEFITDRRTLYIEGYVESNEPNVFSKDEETTISILCPDPNFYSVEENAGLINYPNEDLFEFPFSNESLTDKLIEFSKTDMTDTVEIDYEGDNTTGVTLELFFEYGLPTAQTIEVSFINRVQSSVITIDPRKIFRTSNFNICPGDRVKICGIPGHKKVEFLRLKQVYNVFNAIHLDELWPNLQPGKNAIVIRAGESTEGVKGRILFNTLYDGV